MMKLFNKANKTQNISTTKTTSAEIESKYSEQRLRQQHIPLMGGIAVSLTISLLAGGQAKAASFTFTKVADSTGSFVPQSSPALNNNGTVAFIADLEQFYHQGLFTVTDGSVTKIADTYGSFGSFETFAINDSGLVAFGAESDERIQGIFTSSGGVITPIISASEPFSSDLSGLDLNESDTVAFFKRSGPSGEDIEGIYTSLNGTLTPVLTTFEFGSFAGIPLFPAINDGGTVAFASGGGLVTTNGGGTYTSVIDPSSFISLDSFVSINNSGTVVFGGDFTTGGGGVFTARNGSVTTIATTNDTFLDFYNLAINDRGTVVFSAEIGGGAGLFTGSDPINDKVIAVGDEFFGSTITYLSFSREGLNDFDQIAFYAQLANGTSGIYLALAEPQPQSVPEPSSVLGLLSMVALGTSFQLKRRR